MNAAEGTQAAIRVILVDDHRTVLWGLERLIESASPRMVIAGTATTIDGMLEVAAQNQADIILLDMDLGGRDSTAALPQLAACSKAQVLILTGNLDPAVHARAIFCGARGVLRKNEPAETILRAIERVHAGEAWIHRETVGHLLDRLAQTPGAKGNVDSASRNDAIAGLTPRERQIVQTVVEQRGAKGGVIAGQLGISENTLRNHLSQIYEKLGVRNRIDLYVLASGHLGGLAG
jgi:DNA-binding NarL/FixJ family response regulator